MSELRDLLERAVLEELKRQKGQTTTDAMDAMINGLPGEELRVLEQILFKIRSRIQRARTREQEALGIIAKEDIVGYRIGNQLVHPECRTEEEWQNPQGKPRDYLITRTDVADGGGLNPLLYFCGRCGKRIEPR